MYCITCICDFMADDFVWDNQFMCSPLGEIFFTNINIPYFPIILCKGLNTDELSNMQLQLCVY